MADGNVPQVEYREVPGFPGYRVGSDGTVWSCKDSRARLTPHWRELYYLTSTRGKRRVVLVNRGVKSTKSVPKLVAELFGRVRVPRVRDNVSGVAIGGRYGKWEVIGVPFSIGHYDWMAVSKCECGLITPVGCDSLSHGKSQGCRSCRAAKNMRTHGESRTRLYRVWAGMISRCTNTKEAAYPRYGGRGITVCDEWRRSYEEFGEWALANGYASELEIDRQDNDGNYEPSNCRWVTPKVNARNTRRNRIIHAFGETKCLAEWEEDSRCQVSQQTLAYRLRGGWAAELAIATPIYGYRTNAAAS